MVLVDAFIVGSLVTMVVLLVVRILLFTLIWIVRIALD